MAKLSKEQRRALYGLAPRSDEEARLLQHVLEDRPEAPDPQTPDEVDAHMRSKAMARARRRGGRQPLWLGDDGKPHVPTMEDIRASLPSGAQILWAVVIALILAAALGWAAWMFLDALPW